MCFDGPLTSVSAEWDMSLNTGHRSKSSLISTWWWGEERVFEASMTDDSYSCHLIVLFFVFPRLGSFIITQTTLITHNHCTNSFIKMSKCLLPDSDQLQVWIYLYSLLNIWFQTRLFLFPTQDMIEVEIVAEVDTVMGVHVYIWDNFISTMASTFRTWL